MEKQKQKLLILFGGVSSEHEISSISAASVMEQVDRDQYELYKVGITKEGNWFLTDAGALSISNGSWENNPNNKSAVILPDTGHGGLTVFEQDGSVSTIPIDVVFPVLHGENGEDGTMQGLLDLAQIPYVGPKTTASAASMDKTITKIMIKELVDIKQADFYLTDRNRFAHNPQKVMKEIEQHFGGKYPLFVKPANTGSSVGISKVKNSKALFDGIRDAAECDEKVIVEEAIVGRELEVAVLGNRKPRASKVGEILSANEFYDYDAKYHNKETKTAIVTDLPPEKEDVLRQAAIDIFLAMGCKGLARVDFFLDEAGQPVFNEINTIPGFTDVSMYPKLWEATGISYKELIHKLIQLALGEIE